MGKDLILVDNGGGEGIRTPGGFDTSTVFKTAALNRSATPPRGYFVSDFAYLRIRDTENFVNAYSSANDTPRILSWGYRLCRTLISTTRFAP